MGKMGVGNVFAGCFTALLFALTLSLSGCNPAPANGDSSGGGGSSSSSGEIIPDNNYVARANYGAPVEIPDKVIQGAGQDPVYVQDKAGFDNCFKALNSGQRPAIYMLYTSLKNNIKSDMDYLATIVKYYQDNYNIYIIPQIGLCMTIDGTPSLHYEQDVAAGLYDDKIKDLCDSLEKIAHPVLLRIGYEFNGAAWNGYQTSSYKQAYIHITTNIRSRGLEIATVWCATAESGTLPGYMNYYPGDAYVDWWGIDLFGADQITSTEVDDFLTNAENHNKPVLIGESTARNVGVTNGQTSWDDWFAKYFNLIRQKKGIKAFCYIDWNFAAHPDLGGSSTWGQCQIESNSVVLQNYKKEMAASLYSHASTEAAYRTARGASESTPPSAVNNLNGDITGNLVHLYWDPATDASGILRYEIYTNAALLNVSSSTQYNDLNIGAGDTISYTVRAVDNALNKGAFSSAKSVSIPSSIQKITNGQFDMGLYGWTTLIDSGSISANLDNTWVLSGANSARIGVDTCYGTGDWRLQFIQRVWCRSGRTYQLHLQIKSSVEAPVTVILQRAHDPWDALISHIITVNSTVQTLDYSATATGDDNYNLSIMVGNNTSGNSVWVDNVTLTETKP